MVVWGSRETPTKLAPDRNLKSNNGKNIGGLWFGGGGQWGVESRLSRLGIWGSYAAKVFWCMIGLTLMSQLFWRSSSVGFSSWLCHRLSRRVTGRDKLSVTLAMSPQLLQHECTSPHCWSLKLPCARCDQCVCRICGELKDTWKLHGRRGMDSIGHTRERYAFVHQAASARLAEMQVDADQAAMEGRTEFAFQKVPNAPPYPWPWQALLKLKHASPHSS